MAFATLAGGGPGGFPSRVAKSRAWKKWNLHQLGQLRTQISWRFWLEKSGLWHAEFVHLHTVRHLPKHSRWWDLYALISLIHTCHHSVTLYHFPNILQQEETAATLLGASIPTFRLPICALCKKTSLAVGTAAVFGCAKKLLFLSASAVTLSN